MTPRRREVRGSGCGGRPRCSAPAPLARGGPASRRLAKASRPRPHAAGEVGPAGRPSGTEGRAGWRGCGAGSVPRGARASVPGDLRGVCAGLLPEATSSCTPPSSHQSVPQLCAQGVTLIHLSSPRDLARPSRGPPGWTPPAVGLGLSLALCVPCALGQRAHPLVPQFPHLHALSHERRDGGGIVAASGRGLRPPSPEAAPRSVISSRTPLNFSQVRSVTPGQPSCLLGQCPSHDVAETRSSVMAGTRPRAPRPFRASPPGTGPRFLSFSGFERPCRGARRRRRGRSPSLPAIRLLPLRKRHLPHPPRQRCRRAAESRVAGATSPFFRLTRAISKLESLSVSEKFFFPHLFSRVPLHLLSGPTETAPPRVGLGSAPPPNSRFPPPSSSRFPGTETAPPASPRSEHWRLPHGFFRVPAF